MWHCGVDVAYLCLSDWTHLQKIQKMAKCIFWYQLTRLVPDKVQRAAKWLCACLRACATLFDVHELILSACSQQKLHYVQTGTAINRLQLDSIR